MFVIIILTFLAFYKTQYQINYHIIDNFSCKLEVQNKIVSKKGI
jgi:hypothetical protein